MIVFPQIIIINFQIHLHESGVEDLVELAGFIILACFTESILPFRFTDLVLGVEV